MAESVDVSIITTHRGDPVRLTNLLRSLERQSFPFDRFEWLVVDDASPKGAPDWFEGYDGPIRLVPFPLQENVGRARARNLAANRARGRIIALIDGDMEASSRWLEMLVGAVERKGGIVVGDSVPHPSLPRTAWMRYYHSRGARKHENGSRIPGKYFSSSNAALPVSVIGEGILFDERLSEGWGGEDLELGVRLEKSGATFYTEKAALTLHNHFRTWREMEKNYIRYGESVVPVLIAMHPEMERMLTLHLLRKPDRRFSLVEVLRHHVLRVMLNPPLYRFARTIESLAPRFPWPDILFDFMVFYLYSRTFQTQLMER